MEMKTKKIKKIILFITYMENENKQVIIQQVENGFILMGGTPTQQQSTQIAVSFTDLIALLTKIYVSQGTDPAPVDSAPASTDSAPATNASPAVDPAADSSASDAAPITDPAPSAQTDG